MDRKVAVVPIACGPRLRCRGRGQKGAHVWAALYYSEVLRSEQLTNGCSALSARGARRHGEAERFSGLEIYNQLECGRLLDGQNGTVAPLRSVPLHGACAVRLSSAFALRSSQQLPGKNKLKAGGRLLV